MHFLGSWTWPRFGLLSPSGEKVVENKLQARQGMLVTATGRLLDVRQNEPVGKGKFI